MYQGALTMCLSTLFWNRLLEDAVCLFVIFIVVRYSFLLLFDLLTLVTIGVWLRWSLW